MSQELGRLSDHCSSARWNKDAREGGPSEKKDM